MTILRGLLPPFGLALLLCIAPVRAEEVLEIRLHDGQGQPVPNAAVMVETTAMPQQSVAPESASMNVGNEEFLPQVLVVAAGTEVRFPNIDNTRHHIYSFSPAKTFELPLSADEEAAPVLFDKPGVVKLGCNIHENMRGYVVVSDSPFFGVSDKSGELAIEIKPLRLAEELEDTAEARRIRVWHRQLEEIMEFDLAGNDRNHQQYSLELPVTPEAEAFETTRSYLKERLQRYRR